MDEYVAISYTLLDQVVEWLKEGADILVFAVEEWVDDVFDVLSEYNVVHVFGCSYNFFTVELPVLIFLLHRKSSSKADCMSPR